MSVKEQTSICEQQREVSSYDLLWTESKLCFTLSAFIAIQQDYLLHYYYSVSHALSSLAPALFPQPNPPKPAGPELVDINTLATFCTLATILCAENDFLYEIVFNYNDCYTIDPIFAAKSIQTLSASGIFYFGWIAKDFSSIKSFIPFFTMAISIIYEIMMQQHYIAHPYTEDVMLTNSQEPYDTDNSVCCAPPQEPIFSCLTYCNSELE